MVNKGKKEEYGQSEIMGEGSPTSIGLGRTTREAVLNKLKKRKAGSMRADRSTAKDGEKANIGC